MLVLDAVNDVRDFPRNNLVTVRRNMAKINKDVVAAVKSITEVDDPGVIAFGDLPFDTPVYLPEVFP